MLQGNVVCFIVIHIWYQCDRASPSFLIKNAHECWLIEKHWVLVSFGVDLLWIAEITLVFSIIVLGKCTSFSLCKIQTNLAQRTHLWFHLLFDVCLLHSSSVVGRLFSRIVKWEGKIVFWHSLFISRLLITSRSSQGHILESIYPHV